VPTYCGGRISYNTGMVDHSLLIQTQRLMSIPMPRVHSAAGLLCPVATGFQLKWPLALPVLSIAVLELIPIVFAAGTWGASWRQAQVCFHSDNMAVVVVINKCYSPDQSLIHLLRCLAFFAAYYSFQFSAAHVPGLSITAADALSRDNINLFHSLTPQVSSRSPVPHRLQHLLLSEPPSWGSPDLNSWFKSCLPGASPPQL
jgi:hypothetical protein